MADRPDSVFLSYYTDEPAPPMPSVNRGPSPGQLPPQNRGQQPMQRAQMQQQPQNRPYQTSPPRVRTPSPTQDMRLTPTRPQMVHHQSSSPPRQPQYQNALPPRQAQSSLQNRPQPQTGYHPNGRPQLQVQTSAQSFANGSPVRAQMPAQPPRAAFVSPPSPALSSTETFVGSPVLLKVGMESPLLSPGTPGRNRAGSNVSKASTAADQDRFANAGGTGIDFWKRFSMVVRDVEEEKRTKKKDVWLDKTMKKSAGLKRWIWVLAVVILAAVGGSLAWHFTHNKSTGVTEPSKHDFGLGPDSSSVNPLATLSVNAGVNKRAVIGHRKSGFERRHRNLRERMDAQPTAMAL